MTRALTVRLRILEILERAFPFALPEHQLLVELNGGIRPPAGEAEFDDALLFLGTGKHIVTVPDALDFENVKWAITETGKTLLRQ